MERVLQVLSNQEKLFSQIHNQMHYIHRTEFLYLVHILLLKTTKLFIQTERQSLFLQVNIIRLGLERPRVYYKQKILVL